eukprot:scaffold2016_cov131-Isochrysis_galbana.AAC.1
MLSAWHWRGAHQHINLKEPPPAEKAASLSSSDFLAFSAPREANEASNTKGGKKSLATSSVFTGARQTDENRTLIWGIAARGAVRAQGRWLRTAESPPTRRCYRLCCHRRVACVRLIA